MTIKDKLDKLEIVLSEKHPKLVPNLLAPVIDGLQMNELLMNVVKGYKLHNDLLELYSWKSGTKVSYIKMADYNEIDSNTFIQPSWYIMDFKDSITHFKEKNDIFKYKNEYYFPFLFTGFGHYLTIKLIDLQSKDSEKASNGIFLATIPRKKMYGNYLYYKNMDIYIEALIQCYNQCAYYEYPNGILECDVQKECEICYQLTPNSSHWYLRKFGKLPPTDS